MTRTHNVVVSLLVVAILSLLVEVIHSTVVNDNDDAYDQSSSGETQEPSIGLIGLGGMGVAIAKCLIQHGYIVHAWNRSPKQLEELGLHQDQKRRIQIHPTPHDVFATTDTTFFVINSAPHLQTVVDIITQASSSESRQENDDDDHVLKGKTIINMVNHDPFSAKDLEINTLIKYGIHHISASLFGVPETVCTPGAQILVSAPPRSTSKMIIMEHRQNGPNDPTKEKTTSTTVSTPQPYLTAVGQVHVFAGDVGLASVVYLCLVQSLYFGLAGYELALLVLTKYMIQETSIVVMSDKVDVNSTATTTSFNDDRDSTASAADTLQRFQQLATNILTMYIPAFLPIISNTITQQQWTKSYVPASAAITLFDMHDIVFERLKLHPTLYHATYKSYLQQVVETDGDDVGISTVVQYYSTDGFRIEDQRGVWEVKSTMEENIGVSNEHEL